MSVALSLAWLLESLLFVSAEPVPYERLRATLNCDEAQLEDALAQLGADLSTRGIRLQRSDEGAHLVSAPEHSAVVEKFLGIQAAGKLSAAALETLAIIAYRQPISRLNIEDIRGVNSDRLVRGLVAQGLVQEVGRASVVGRPVLYGTTEEFLQRFGLESLDQLPEIEDMRDGHSSSSADTDGSK